MIGSRFLRMLCLATGFVSVVDADDTLKVGLVGLDTSHVIAFAKAFADPGSSDYVSGAKIVAAYKGGSADIARSRDRVDGFTQRLKDEFGVAIYETIEEVCERVDALMLTSVDGRKHLPQIRRMLPYGKPIYIDKPMAASLADVVEIFRLADGAGAPVFSSSSLRFGKGTMEARHGKVGQVRWAETFSPCHLEPTHPDLFWYGVHGVEALFAVMREGCRSVKRGETADGRIEVVGYWEGDRVGVYRESVKGYGGFAVGSEGQMFVGPNEGKRRMLFETLQFFRTGDPPVPASETIELFAFMAAADLSKQRGGAEVALSEIINAAGSKSR